MKKEYGIVLSIIMVMAVVIAIPFAIGCGGGGTEATGDILYEGSTASEEVVQDWAGAIFAGTETGISATFVDANDGVTFTVDNIVKAGATTMAAADTTEVITHGLGGTPLGVSAIPNGWSGGTVVYYSVGTTTLTSTQFTVTRSGTDTVDREILWIAVK